MRARFATGAGWPDGRVLAAPRVKSQGPGTAEAPLQVRWAKKGNKRKKKPKREDRTEEQKARRAPKQRAPSIQV